MSGRFRYLRPASARRPQRRSYRTTSARGRARLQAARTTVRAFQRMSRPPNFRTGGYLGLENKFLDTGYGPTTIPSPTDATGGEADPTTYLSLTSIPQGNGESARIGKKCTVNSVYVAGNVYIAPQVNQTAVDTTCNIFIALVHDQQTNAAQLNSEDVFANPSTSGLTCAMPLRNLEYTSRFKVLDSVLLRGEQAVAVWDGTNIETGGFQLPFKLAWNGTMPIIFSDTTGVIANVVDNSVHVIAFASNASQAPVLVYNARVRFTG